MNLRHLEWLIGEPVPDPEVVVYAVLPYAPVLAERIIEHLCRLARLDVGQADQDPVCAERVRQAFGYVVEAARARQAVLSLDAIEREIGRPPWRDLLKDLRHDRGRFDAAIRDKSARIALHWALSDLGLAGRAGCRWLHHLRDHAAVLRRVIDRALEARLLQRDAGRSDRHDRVGPCPGREPCLAAPDGQTAGSKPHGQATAVRPRRAGAGLPRPGRSAGD